VKTKGSSEESYVQRADVLEKQLQAKIWFAEGKRTEAIALIRKAAEMEEAMPLAFGPPFVDKPTQEILGEMLLTTERPVEAEEAFRAALARAPLRTASLLGLMRSARLVGNHISMEESQRKLREIWKQAPKLIEEYLVPSR